MNISAVVKGVLVLTTTQLVIGNAASTGRVTALLAWPAAGLRWVLSPDVPGLPDRRVPAVAAESTASTQDTATGGGRSQIRAS